MKHRWIVAALMMSLLIAACQSQSSPEPVVSQQTESSGEGSQPTMAAAEDQAADAASTSQDAQAPPTEVPVRQGLAATDPASVNLANGSPTFVEFFAFW